MLARFRSAPELGILQASRAAAQVLSMAQLATQRGCAPSPERERSRQARQGKRGGLCLAQRAEAKANRHSSSDGPGLHRYTSTSPRWQASHRAASARLGGKALASSSQQELRAKPARAAQPCEPMRFLDRFKTVKRGSSERNSTRKGADFGPRILLLKFSV